MTDSRDPSPQQAYPVFKGPRPEPGDLIRVTRTEVHTRVYEGYYREVEPDDRSDSGWSFVECPYPVGASARLRDQGPVTFWLAGGEGRPEGTNVESDVIEVIEARDGRPYDGVIEESIRNHHEQRRAKAREARKSRRANSPWRRMFTRINPGAR